MTEESTPAPTPAPICSTLVSSRFSPPVIAFLMTPVQQAREGPDVESCSRRSVLEGGWRVESARSPFKKNCIMTHKPLLSVLAA